MAGVSVKSDIYDRVNNTNKRRRHVSILNTENCGFRSICPYFLLYPCHWNVDAVCQFYYHINVYDLRTWFDAMNSFFCINPLQISFKRLGWFWAVSVVRSGCTNLKNSNRRRPSVQSTAKSCRHSCDRCHSQSYTKLFHCTTRYTFWLEISSCIRTGNTNVTHTDNTFY